MALMYLMYLLAAGGWVHHPMVSIDIMQLGSLTSGIRVLVRFPTMITASPETADASATP